MPAPHEIIIGPADVYVADPGTAFPSPNDAPGGGWTLVGTAGSRNYAESGVVIRRNVTMNYVRTLGSTAARKAAISEVGFEIEFNVLDLSPEALALGYGVALDQVDVDPGETSFELSTSPFPLQLAVLVRANQSPEGEDANTQWEIVQAVQAGSGEGTFSKTDAFGAGHMWSAIEDSNGGFVRYVVGHSGS